VSIDPASAATGVQRTAPVIITFSEAVDPATITSATLTLDGPSGAVAWTKSLGSGNSVVTLTPAAPLQNYAAYTVRVTTGVKDASGNALAAARTSDFTTRDDVAPALAGPVNDAGDFDDGTVTLSWPDGAADDGSGVAAYEVRIAVGAQSYALVPDFVTTATTLSLDASSYADGDVMFAQVRAVDAAGNVGAPVESDGVTLDLVGPSAPGVPVGPGAFAFSSPVRFTWDPADDGGLSGVASYHVTAATSTSGLIALFATPPGAGTFTDVTASDGTTVYVQVAAVDGVGNAGDVSGWSTAVKVDLNDPIGPTTISHAAGSVLASPVTFAWPAATDANGIAYYVLQVTTGSNGTGDPVFLGTTPATSLPVFAPDGQIVHARVRAVDAAGRLGAWSPSAPGVKVDAAGPAAPPAPDDGALTGKTLAVSWTAAHDATGSVAAYFVQASPDPTFASTDVQNVGAGNATSTTFSDVSRWDGRTIYTRVRGDDQFGHPGAYSPSSDGVLVDTSPPTMPGIPQDGGAASASTALHFFWAPSSDATSGVAGYTCDIAEGTGRIHLATLESSVPSCDYVAQLNQTIYARVRARDVAGNVTADFTDWSDGMLVTTAVPGTPTAPSADARYLDHDTVAFHWTAPPGFGGAADDEYVLEIGTSPGAADVDRKTLDASQTDYTFHGAHGVTYYARVAAESETMGRGAFSGSSDGVTVDLTDPGTPTGVAGRGPVDDPSVAFTWSPAVDAESGVASYDVELQVNGLVVGTFATPTASYTYGPALGGASVQARARAVNGAGRRGGWSALSPAVTVDDVAPFVMRGSPDGGTQPTGVDVVVEFSEAMDPQSVASALSISWDGGTVPKNGYVFHWDAGSRRVTIVPDTQDPKGETNVDLLPEKKLVTVTVGTTATDLAGNRLSAPCSFSFTTADETAPRVVSFTANGTASPFLPEDVETATTLAISFDEDMSTSRASFSVELGDGRRIEGGIGSANVSAVSQAGGRTTFTLTSCPDVRVGDRVAVRDTNPRDFEVSLALVSAVVTTPQCAVTVNDAGPAGKIYDGGGWMSVPGSGGGPRVQWTGPRTLELAFDATALFPPGSERMLEVWNVQDLEWNYAQVREAIQVRPRSDASAPRVVSTIPASGGTGDGTAPIILRFSEPVRAATVSGITVDCLGCAGLYDVKYTPDQYGPMAILTPRASPPENAFVTVHVPPTVLDLAGNAAVPADVTFTVGPYGDSSPPMVRETNPPDGEPVDWISQVEVSFEDSGTHVAEPLDARSVGPNDVRVLDVTPGGSGLLVRGFHTEVEPGTAILTIRGPNRGPSLSTGWRRVDVGRVVASFDPGLGTSVATYTTLGAHGMSGPGAKVQVDMFAPGTGQFGVWDAQVLAIPSPTEFVVAWNGGAQAVGDGASPIGNAGVPSPRQYLVSILGVPGADGIADAHGNPLADASFEVNVQPWGNRVPLAESMRDVRLSAETSSVARSIEARARVKDPDGGDVSVSLWAADGVAALTSTVRTISVGSMYGSSEYRYPEDGGGPPFANQPAEMAGAGASGYRAFDIVLNDGAAETRYRRDLWVWSPADVPAVDGIDDGGVVRPSGPKPIVVEGGDPAFRWTHLDAAHADLAALYVLSLDGLDDGNAGMQEVFPFAPVEAGWARLARTLEPDVYLWTVVQQKFAPGFFEPASSAYAIDFANLSHALFAVGPDNRSLGGKVFAGARGGFEAFGGSVRAGGAGGTWSFEAGSGGAAPVLVTEALVDHQAMPLPAAEQLFAYGAGKRFTVTQSGPLRPGEPVALPLPMHGVVGLGGTFFAAAQEHPDAPGVQAAALRFQETGFGTSLDARFAWVMTEGRTAGGGGAGVGYADFGPALVATIAGTESGGDPFAAELPYTLGNDGLLSLEVESGDTPQLASGLLGGAPGAEIAVLATADAANDGYFWLLVARAYAWSGGEDRSLVSGTYRFADLAAEFAGGSLQGARGASGTMTFDPLSGTVAYEGSSHDVSFAGYGSYDVDPVAGVVTFHRLDANPGPTDYTFAVGPNAGLLLGASTAAANVAEVIVLAR
jgi:hypothetical protein